MKEIARPCEEFAYRRDPADTSEPYKSLCYENDPKCVHYGEERCSDTCGTTLSDEADPGGIDASDNGVGGDLVGGPGVCEDGGGTSADLCPRGTDCSDCGPRTCTPAGERCSDPEDCCEYFSSGAFCVDLGTTAVPDTRCLLPCAAGRSCPEAFTCRDVVDDLGDVAGSACVPP
jgi:hypothetical protein